jgi:cell division protein FtsB
MRKLIEHRYLVRRNLPALVGMCLALYFTYNIGFGERSAFELLSLTREANAATESYDNTHAQRVALESQVVRLRPGSIDRDLLEQRARVVLGYTYPDEHIVLSSQ